MGFIGYKEKEIGDCEECHDKPAKHFMYVFGFLWSKRKLLCTDCLIDYKDHHNVSLRSIK